MRLLALPAIPEPLREVLEQLDRAGLAVLLAPAESESRDDASLPPADLLMCDAGRAIAMLQRRPVNLPAPLLAVWGADEQAIAALGIGADVWLDPSEPPDRLAARVRALARRAARREGARVDALTGLMNRSMLEDLLAHEFDRASRYRRALALIVIEPDGIAALKPESADRVRIDLAGRLRASIRDVDTLAAAGGARFALILPETDAGGAMAAAARLHSDLGGAPGTGPRRGTAVTVSVGVAAYPSRAIETWRNLFGRALEGLQQATNAGGNRAVAFGAPDVIWSREAPDPSTL